jgi:hypothetical protein
MFDPANAVGAFPKRQRRWTFAGQMRYSPIANKRIENSTTPPPAVIG